MHVVPGLFQTSLSLGQPIDAFASSRVLRRLLSKCKSLLLRISHRLPNNDNNRVESYDNPAVTVVQAYIIMF